MTLRQMGFTLMILAAPFLLLAPVDLLPAGTPIDGPDSVILDDDLDAIRARFEAQLEQTRKEFRKQLEELQEGPRRAVEEARVTVARLEAENQRLKRELKELSEVNARLLARINAVDDRPRGMLGIAGIEPDEETMRRFGFDRSSSILVTAVVPGSPADSMGLRVGDVITALAGKEMGLEEFISVMKNQRAGDAVVISFQRSEADGILEVTSRTTLVKWDDEIASTAEQASTVPPTEPVEVTSIPAIPLEPMPPPPVEPDRTGDEPVAATKGVRLGVSVRQDEEFRLVVTDVEDGSNASVAGIKVGDVIQSFGGVRVRTIDGLRDVLQETVRGSVTGIGFSRDGRVQEVRVQLAGEGVSAARIAGTTAPEVEGAPAGFLGIAPEERDGVLVVVEVVPGTCAAEMGLKVGDVLVSIDGSPIDGIEDLRARMTGRQAGSTIHIEFRREGDTQVAHGNLGEHPTGEQGAAPRRSITAPVARAIPRENEEKLGVIVVVEGNAAVVEEVLPGSAARSAGIRRGDQIVEITGIQIESFDDLSEILASRADGEGLTFSVLRDGEVISLKVVFADSSAVPASFSEGIEVAGKFSTAPVKPLDLPNPYLGMEVEENARGLTVTAVESGDAADLAGIRVADRLLKVAGIDVITIEDVRGAISTIATDTFQIEVTRDGVTHIFEVGAQRR